MNVSTLKTLQDFDVTGKKVLLRVAYDFSLKEENGKIISPDHARIRDTIPTIQYLLERGCSIGLLSWLKRPNGTVEEKLRMKPVAEKLSELLGKPVEALNDCVGAEVEARVQSMQSGEILMLENVRFHSEEDLGDDSFAKALTSGFDCIVFDAFAQAHRTSASVVGIVKHLPACLGLLMQKELEIFGDLVNSPEHPFVVVMGGAKISDKVGILKVFVEKADCILIGGALANTFFSAQGVQVAKSMIDDVSKLVSGNVVDDPFAAAREILDAGSTTLSLGDAQVDKVQLPLDLVAASGVDSTETVIVNIDKGEVIPEGYSFLDIGPRTIDLYKRALMGARMIFANGPMGLFEKSSFEKGTQSVARAIIDSGARSVLGGGDTESMITKFGMDGKFTHVSTGGGAALEFLAGQEFEVLKYLTK